jgi:AcrR family transcriptional regulator
MGTIKKGLTTKEKILVAARKFFYKYGYANTKINMITIETGISRTLINYHFSSKEELLIQVMKDYLDEIYTFVDEHVTDDPLMKYCVFYDLYYANWVSDDKMKTFLIEVLERDNRVLATYMNFDIIYRGILKQFRSPLNDRERLLKEVAIFGANREFILNYTKGVITIPYDQFLENIIRNGCILLGIKNITINDYLKKYAVVSKNLDSSHLKFYRGSKYGK